MQLKHMHDDFNEPSDLDGCELLPRQHQDGMKLISGSQMRRFRELNSTHICRVKLMVFREDYQKKVCLPSSAHVWVIR